LGYEQTIRVWDTEEWREERVLQPDDSGVRGLAFSPDERAVALSMEGKVQLWSFEDWRLERELPVSTKVVNGVAFSPDERWLAAGAADGRIRVWEQRQ
jgi:WD40 repeat protein